MNVNNNIICFCSNTNVKEVKRIVKKPTFVVGDVQRITGASMGCGRCRQNVERLIDNELSFKKYNTQIKINFDQIKLI